MPCWRATVGTMACSFMPCRPPASTASRRARAGARTAIASCFSRRLPTQIRAGSRACLRCRPDEANVVDLWIDKVRRACVYLANVDGHVPLARLASRLGGSPYHLQRSFSSALSASARASTTDACRLQKVKQKLRKGERVTDAMVAAGYGSSRGFYEKAASKLAMKPQTYRRGGAGKAIAYAIVDSPLDRLLVAATTSGVCAIFMGSTDADLERALQLEFPAATLEADHRGLKKWAREIVRHLEGRRPRLDLPLDIQATAFQWQVWNALSEIPYGETRTYKEVAASIGRLTAIRAVAHACASNPVSLAIPCHRVVRTKRRFGRLPVGARPEAGAALAAEHKMKD